MDTQWPFSTERRDVVKDPSILVLTPYCLSGGGGFLCFSNHPSVLHPLSLHLDFHYPVTQIFITFQTRLTIARAELRDQVITLDEPLISCVYICCITIAVLRLEAEPELRMSNRLLIIIRSDAAVAAHTMDHVHILSSPTRSCTNFTPPIE